MISRTRGCAPLVLLAMLALTSPATAGPTSMVSPVVVLPFVPMTVDEYSVVPRAEQLASLTTRVRMGVASPPLHLVVLPQPRVTGAACAEAGCARQIGRALGARTVVFGKVVRFTGIRWNTEVSAVQVSTGRIVDTLT